MTEPEPENIGYNHVENLDEKSPPEPIDLEEYESGMFEITRHNRWEDVGMQRPIADFFFNYFYMIVIAVVGLVAIAVIYPLIFPWPEVNGYNSVAKNLFAWAYTLFDTGTAFGITQFIAHYRIKNPRKMIGYIQFFVWYQMFTGLAQITFISIYIYMYLATSNMAHLTWVFLLICIRQWPGMLNVFRDALRGLQQYGKYRLLKFLGDEGFQQVSYIIFILIGREIGARNPSMGELMGAVIGYAIGAYVDDFFTMMVAGRYFNKTLKPFGYSVWDCFRTEFSREIMKDSIWFGAQAALNPIINSITSLVMVNMYLDALPQYTTFLAIAGIAKGITGIMKAQDFQMTASIAESYMNGKKKLAKFYVESSLKWNGFLIIFLTMTLLSVMPMLVGEILQIPGLENYVLAAGFFAPALIANLVQVFERFPDGIITGARHVGFYTFMRVFEEGAQVFFVWLYLYGLRLQVVFGFSGVIFILAFEHAFPRMIKSIFGFIFIQKRILKIRVNWYQTFVVPLVASAPSLVIGFIYSGFLYEPMKSWFAFLGVYATAGPGIIFLLIIILVVPLTIYMPLSGYLGGWDDFQLLNLKKAITLCGPMKPIAKLFYKTISFGARRSKLHNRFKIPWEGALKEITELMVLKEAQENVSYEAGSSLAGESFKKWKEKKNGEKK